MGFTCEFTLERSAILRNKSLAAAAERLLVPMLLEERTFLKLSLNSRATFLEAVVGRLSEVAPAKTFEKAMGEVLNYIRMGRGLIAMSQQIVPTAPAAIIPPDDNFGFTAIDSRCVVMAKEHSWQRLREKLSRGTLCPQDIMSLSNSSDCNFTVQGWSRRFADERAVCILQLAASEQNVTLVEIGLSDESMSKARQNAASRLINAV